MRVLAVWCPDWPVVAGLSVEGAPEKLPAAVFHANRARATNQAAREFGVRRGMRRRDAQARCPELVVLDDDPGRDAQAFEAVLGALEEARPGVAALRPGLAALAVPPRYFGGEQNTAAALAERVVGTGVWDVRCGIADELWTAEQASRLADRQDCRVIPAGGSREFLAGLGVEVLGEPAELLRRLGVRTLGDLAGLPAVSVRDRFGTEVAWVHRLLHGIGGRDHLDTRTPPPELARHVDFEPPLDRADQVCFSSRTTAEAFLAGLAGEGLVCTGVRIEGFTEDAVGEFDAPSSARTWLHPRWFSATDLVDRLHWQLQGDRIRGGADPGRVRAPIARIRFVPVDVADEAVHAEGLWGGTEEQVERGIARVQGMLGPEAVRRVVLVGGRAPADRQELVPWGERAAPSRPADRPWPGRIPGPPPTRVLTPPRPAQVLGDAGRPVVVDPRGMVSDRPARFTTQCDSGVEGWQPIASWAGPWPVDEEWWEPGGRRLARFQFVGVDGRAWLLACSDGTWTVEGIYD